MNLALIIIHAVISVLLIAVVLLQHGKQQGLSGAIAGGAETFFGKNKGRTIDAMLKKFTAVLAILFIVSSLVLTATAVRDLNATTEETAITETATDATAETATDATAETTTDATAETATDATAEAKTDATAEAETDATAEAETAE